MNKIASLTTLATACGCLVLAACNQSATAPAVDPANTLHEVMKTRIDANADAIWDITNAAMGQAIDLDPAKLDDAKWAQIADLATKVADGAHTLAAMDPVVVAAPGVTLGDQGEPGGHTAEQVQGYIDADTATFRNMATTLADHATHLAQAAQAKDPVAAGELVSEMDAVCEACHLSYWYPEQRALIEANLPGGVAGTDSAASDSSQ